MDYRELLAADIAVEHKLLTPEEAVQGLERLSDADRAGIEEQIDRLLAESRGDARLALARRGVDRKLHQSLSPKAAHEVTDAGARVRVALRTLPEDRYVGFLPLGQGGMGVVYLALDTELNRKVAFKMVRGESDKPLDPAPQAIAEETEARFLQEAWVTGGLEHPGIVPVYELGRTPSGIPYYTMRLVRGERTMEDAITEAKTAEERLALLEPFLKVCDALRYAHARGVIHRDLKPANIALGPFGEVVVIDWGLAKMNDRPDVTGSVWQSRLDAIRMETAFETLTSSMGTPGYMAPEAALGQLANVDRRSDIYSLGAILFRILTGRLPFKFSNYIEFVNQVDQGVREVPGAPAGLERICLKALAVEREERFHAVDELADAIRTWQYESSVDREVQGLMQEAGAALQVAAAMEGDQLLHQIDHTIAIAVRIRDLRPDHAGAEALLLKARERRADAISERETLARRKLMRRVGVVGLLTATAATIVVAVMLNAQRKDAEQARARAETERGRAEELATFMLGDLRAGLEPVGRLDLLGKVASRSLEYYQTLPEEHVTDEARHARGVALANVGDVLFATGELGPAEKSYAAALAVAGRLVSLQPENLAWCRTRFRALIGLGSVGRARGDAAASLRRFREAVTMTQRLVERHSADEPARQDLAIALNMIGDVERGGGNLAEALGKYRESHGIIEELARRNPGAVEWQRQLSVGLDRIGNIERQSGDLPAALASFRESLAISQRLADSDPANTNWQRDLYVSLTKLGTVEKDGGDRESAERRFRAALAISRRLFERDPSNSVWELDLSTGLELVGTAARERGDLMAALESYLKSAVVARRVCDRDRANMKAQNHLVIVLTNLGDTQAGLGKPDDAIASYREARGFAAGLVAKNPKNSDWQRQHAVALYRLGTALQRTASVNEAVEVLAEALRTHEAVVRLASHRESEHVAWVDALHVAELMAGKKAPANAQDHLALAYGVYHRKDYERAAPAFLKAFESEQIRADLDRRVLYSAACAASLVSGADAERWHAQGMAWLREDITRRRAVITKVEAALAQEGVTAEQRAELERIRAHMQKHIDVARDLEPDFAVLRKRPEFAELFGE